MTPEEFHRINEEIESAEDYEQLAQTVAKHLADSIDCFVSMEIENGLNRPEALESTGETIMRVLKHICKRESVDLMDVTKAMELIAIKESDQ